MPAVTRYRRLLTHLFSNSLQSSGRLIPGCAHKAQNIAIDPSFCSSFSPYPKPNHFQEMCSPLPGDPQQLLISVLNLPISLPSADVLSSLTSTEFGNSSFVILLRQLKNWLGVVLHSRLSKWNSSSTWKVNAVFGLRNVAGKSPAIINCMSRSGASGQEHQLMPISWTPDLSTTVII